MEGFIENNGDYFFVANCTYYDACEHTAYKSQISMSPWPAGGFFYGAYCPLGTVLNFTDCIKFYRVYAMALEVSFAQLGYAMLLEEPTTTEWGLFNSLAGNIDLWLGCSMLGLAEFVLIGIQIVLWICRCRKELPEVPSLRRLNFFPKDNKKSDTDESVNGDSPASNIVPLGAIQAAGDPCDALTPKNFPNSLGEEAFTRREVRAMTPAELELYDPLHGFEPVLPIIAQTSEHAGHFTDA
ncbi:UNC-8 protein [Aphelenchoides avenae]|nr:UNC-8 protein [Aphelenchus avenae]